MKECDWKNAKMGLSSHEQEWLKNQKKAERMIVKHYASEHGLDYRTAERQCAESGLILKCLSSKILNFDLRQDTMRVFEERTKNVRELTDIGERAIQEFEKLHAQHIIFPYAKIDYGAFGGWIGTPWHEEYNFDAVKRRFNQEHNHFTLVTVIYGTSPLTFTFGYDLLDITTKR